MTHSHHWSSLIFDKYYLFLSEIDDVKYSENDKVKYKENLIFEILIIYNFLEKSLLDLLNKKGGKKWVTLQY